MARLAIKTMDALSAWQGREFPVSDWATVTQQQVDLFAQATGDHQWIHVDALRAATETPWGVTIAHGFLVLSLLSRLWADTLQVGDARLGINYGVNRVRFTAPLKTGSRIRARFALLRIEPIEGGVQMTLKATLEVEGACRPCCVAEWISRKLR